MAATKEAVTHLRQSVYELERLVNKLYYDTVGDKIANPDFVAMAEAQAVKVQTLIGNLYGTEVAL